MRRVAWMLVIAMLASACSLLPFGASTDDLPEAEAGQADGDIRWLTAEECANLSLAETTAEPLTRIPINGWPDPAPDHHGVVLARVLYDEVEADDAPVIVVPHWHDPVSLAMPLHPADPTGGGALAVQLGQAGDSPDDQRWCAETHDLEVLPLSAADATGSLLEQLAFIEQLVDGLVADDGLSARALAGRGPDAVAEALLPAWILAELLHAEDGLYATVAELSEEEETLADRLIGGIQHGAAAQFPTEFELIDETQPEREPANDDPDATTDTTPGQPDDPTGPIPPLPGDPTGPIPPLPDDPTGTDPTTGDPADPTGPGDPADPAQPGDPADPTQPGDPTGDDPTGTDPADPTGDDPTGGDPTGSDPTGDDPTDTDPTGTDPTGTDPTGTDPTGSDPTGTDPTGTDPTGSDPTGTDPTGTDPTGDDPRDPPTDEQPPATDECIPTDFAGLTTLLGRQISGATMAGGSTGFALDAAMTIGGLPGTGLAGTATVLTAWATAFAAEYLEGMMPSNWERTDIEHDPDELWEDDVDGGYVEAIAMRFTSDGYDAGPRLAELALTIAGEAASKVLAGKLHTPTGGQGWGDALVDSLDQLEADLVADVVTWIGGEILGGIIDVTGLAEGIVVLDPRCWDARMEDPELSDEVRLHYLDAIERGTQDTHFVAARLGTGIIEAQWELPIGQALLGVGLSRDVRDATMTFGTSGTVEVRSLSVTWDPARQQVEAGQQVTLHLEVHQAHDGDVHVTDPHGQFDDVIDATGGTTLTYHVPDDWDGTPIPVLALSLSETGMRDPAHPHYRGEVEATAWLVPESDGMFLEPLVGCLANGEVVRFTVTDEPLGGNPVEVTWSASAGTIEADGTYTAPSSASEVTVTATSVEDPDRQVTRTFDVGDCQLACSWELRIDGEFYDHSGVVESGNMLSLTGVDWDTGAFSGLALRNHEDGHISEPLVLSTTDPSGPSTATTRSMLPAGHTWDLTVNWSGLFQPGTDRVNDWELDRLVSDEIPDLEVAPLRAELEHDLVMVTDPPMAEGGILPLPEHPSIPMRGQVQGPFLLGVEVTDTVDGHGRADTRGLIAEPDYGTLTLSFEGLFLPDIRPGIPALPGSEREMPGMVRLDDHAQCGPLDSYSLYVD